MICRFDPENLNAGLEVYALDGSYLGFAATQEKTEFFNLSAAQEAAALDLLSDGRVALGVSRGSPETALRGYEAFGYTGSSDPRGADIARVFIAEMRSLANKTEAALEELT